MQLAWSRFMNHATKVPVRLAALIAMACAGCGDSEPGPPGHPVSFALHNWCSGAIDVYARLELKGSVTARDHIGGTAPRQVRSAVRRLRRQLALSGRKREGKS